MVVVESLDQAKDAMELIEVRYAPIAAVTASDLAMAPSAPVVWDECPDNVSHVFEIGNRVHTQRAFETAVNAIKDALLEIGVTEFEMPATPFRVWQAINQQWRRAHA
jgi:CO/xanthine dehydrogenase Mo-binding subunit